MTETGAVQKLSSDRNYLRRLYPNYGKLRVGNPTQKKEHCSFFADRLANARGMPYTPNSTATLPIGKTAYQNYTRYPKKLCNPLGYTPNGVNSLSGGCFPCCCRLFVSVLVCVLSSVRGGRVGSLALSVCPLLSSLAGVLVGGSPGFCLGWFCGFCCCGSPFCSGSLLRVLSLLSSLGSVSFGSSVLVSALFLGCRVAGFACPFPLSRRFGWVGSSGRFVLPWSPAVPGLFRLCGCGCLLLPQTTLQQHRPQHLHRFWQQREKFPLRPAGFVAGASPRHFYKYA